MQAKADVQEMGRQHMLEKEKEKAEKDKDRRRGEEALAESVNMAATKIV